MPVNKNFARKMSFHFIGISFLFILFTTSLFAQAPSSILPDIVNFKINFPLDANEDDYTGVDYDDRDNPHIKSETEDNLSGYTAPGDYEDYFYVSGGEVVFKAHCAGALTSINAYPRCELREQPGGTDSFWNFTDEQELNATFTVTHLPDVKKEVCMLQIKGSNTGNNSGTSEVLRLEYREGSQGLHIVINETTTLNYIMPYDLDEILEAKLYVNNGDVTVDLTNITTGDTYFHEYASDYDFGYFKAGCYTQSSIWEEKNGIADELPTAYGEVRFSELTLGASCSPTPLANLFADNITETTATLNWDYDADMDHYNARFRPTGSSTWAYKYSLHAGTVDITGLLNDTDYEWQVRAKCPDGTATNYVDGAGPVFTTLPSVVPVELIGFKGYFEGRYNRNSLQWQTSSEINNKGFVIERSIDPINNFEEVGWTDGRDNPDVINSYVFNDSEIKNGERYYYRLKQVDLDGQSAFSKTIVIQTDQANKKWAVFPNPIVDHITIRSENLKQDVEGIVEIMDMNGRVVYTTSHQFQSEGEITLNIGNLAPGIYSFVIRNSHDEILITKRMISI